ncbi:MAG: bifunctional 2-polyprenyl-6-hydroxyphenol methylase/3-demethylubiquinol 3-O-methyltransferase UbiG [Alphaproteobacteria bacterium]|nr:bifunctional 2-polyprenyl-6-hydroxyphenol methylase/3-demethylubiquinol 3-O-methyltransferase UbiG [Alphaproteobacteria bacterium]
MHSALHAQTVAKDEVARFAKMADRWWDPQGPMKPLHKMNPARVAFLKGEFARHFGRDSESPQPFKGLTLLDVGTGAGLIAEPMARLGFTVTGIDAAQESIAAAQAHAEAEGLSIDYRTTTTDALLKETQRFDAVLAMEIVEHVPDAGQFLAEAAALVAPQGAFAGATVSRTTKSYLMGIVGAEMILRWLPVGTHDWNKFLKPSEFTGHLRRSGLKVTALQGLGFNPLTDRWSATSDLDVNYLIFAQKDG